VFSAFVNCVLSVVNKCIPLLCLGILLAGCAGERPASMAKRDGILLLGNGPEPTALDPHVTTGTAELNIQMALFEGLLSPDPETLEPLPGVAHEWRVSEDGLTYRFLLREDAVWSDGNPVRAEDFAAAWERALNPAQGAPYATMLHVLEGAEAYNKGQTKDFSSVGVRIVDSNTLEVRLHQFVPYFLNALIHPVWYPIPSHRLNPAKVDRVGDWTTADAFIGNGPFVLKEWLPNQYVEVIRNEQYWDASAVFLNGARFMAIDEPGAEERAYLAGQLHVTDSLPPTRVRAYQEKHSPDLHIDPYLGTYYVLPNTREGVLSDPKVRRALALSIDRQAITEQLLGAGQTPAGGLVPDTMPGYEGTIPVEYDPHMARALLADAGFPGGEGFPELEYMFNSSESHRQIAVALQSMWREELGIFISLTNLEWRTYLQRRASADFQLARAVWIGDYLDPSTFLTLWTTGNPNNWAGWENPSYDALLHSSLSTRNPSSRMRSYALTERFLISEQAVIPLYHYVTAYLLDPSVRGWHANLLDWHPLKYVSFE
jgi:oligopeptide transport system substrate-binding protein